MNTIIVVLLLQLGTIVLSQATNSTYSDGPRIIIIGAGLAGVSALSKLIENGYENVLLLEFAHRMGGRIVTIPFGANVADLGSVWIHGEKGNIIYEMVGAHGVVDRTPLAWIGAGGTSGNFYSSDGHNRPEYGLLDEMTHEIYKTFDEDLAKFQGPLGVFLTDQYNQFLRRPKFRNIRREFADEFLPYFEQGVNVDTASDSWFITSASTFYETERIEGYQYINFNSGGFKTVFDFITKKRPDPRNDLQVERKILYNKEVNNIRWDRLGRQQISVSCTDGTVYNADHVIVTVSLGVLKHDHQTLFTPQLPRYKRNAIEGLAYGTMNKILLEFDQAFWPSDWSGFGMIWTQQDAQEILNTPISWVRDMMGFGRVMYQPNVLFGFVTGETGRKIENMPHSEILTGVRFLFDKFLIPHMNYTMPRRVLVTDWFRRQNFRGSYSFRSTQTDAFNAWAEELEYPVSDFTNVPRLLFSGEATHSTFFSTAHGAVESGYREADRLINFYRNRTL